MSMSTLAAQLIDAIRRAGGIEWAHVRNEESGAFAAAAIARNIPGPTGR